MTYEETVEQAIDLVVGGMRTLPVGERVVYLQEVRNALTLLIATLDPDATAEKLAGRIIAGVDK